MNQYIIIDGLDECEVTERRTLLQFLNSIVDRCDSYKPGKIRVLLVSRDVADIRKSMQSAGIFDLAEEDTKKDIKVFVRQKVVALTGEPFRLTDEDGERVERMTCERAHGKCLAGMTSYQYQFD